MLLFWGLFLFVDLFCLLLLLLLPFWNSAAPPSAAPAPTLVPPAASSVTVHPAFGERAISTPFTSFQSPSGIFSLATIATTTAGVVIGRGGWKFLAGHALDMCPEVSHDKR